jgi:hypothetical protein
MIGIGVARVGVGDACAEGRADETGNYRSRRVGLVCAHLLGERHDITLFEASIWSHRQDPELAALAPYVTSKVTLWPQMDVLLANPARLEALTGEQRHWLEQAAQHAAARSAALADADARALGQSCASGVRFAEAIDADLAALEAAFAPASRTSNRTRRRRHSSNGSKRSSSPPPPEPEQGLDCRQVGLTSNSFRRVVSGTRQ